MTFVIPTSQICLMAEKSSINSSGDKAGLSKSPGLIFLVHFTDYLTHKGIEHTYRCSQKLTLDADGKIVYIEHLEDLAERANLDEFYRQVGLKT